MNGFLNGLGFCFYKAKKNITVILVSILAISGNEVFADGKLLVLNPDAGAICENITRGRERSVSASEYTASGSSIFNYILFRYSSGPRWSWGFSCIDSNGPVLTGGSKALNYRPKKCDKLGGEADRGGWYCIYKHGHVYPLDGFCSVFNKDGDGDYSHIDPDCGASVSASFPAKGDGNPNCGATSLAIGNPINLSSGNKYQSELIFLGNTSFSLNYNSNTGMWRHSQAYSLDITDTEILLIRPDGKGLTFTQQGSQWQSDGDVFHALSEYDDGAGSGWKVVTPSGDTELYDAAGRILIMTTLQSNTTTFSYTDSKVSITSSQGDTLVLEESADGRLQRANLNEEVAATFEYDDQQRLIARVAPDGNRTQYHYENTDFPKHLTGITGPDGQRFATWAYDSEGRGILSEHAGQERAELVFNADGSTTVTNALGKQTTYHFTEIEGLKRVTRVEGHATEHCVGANKAYSYYDSGLLKTKTDWGGNTTRYEYNPRGLITRIVEADSTTQARTVEQSWHPSLPLLEQRTDGTQSTRFNYDTQHRLLQTEVQRQTP